MAACWYTATGLLSRIWVVFTWPAVHQPHCTRGCSLAAILKDQSGGHVIKVAPPQQVNISPLPPSLPLQCQYRGSAGPVSSARVYHHHKGQWRGIGGGQPCCSLMPLGQAGLWTGGNPDSETPSQITSMELILEDGERQLNASILYIPSKTD